MSYLIDNGLKMLISMSLKPSLEDAVADIVTAHENNDDDGVRKHYLEYQKVNRLIDLGYQMLFDGKLKEWDWQWASDNGYLCDMDWEWFKEDLEKAKVSKEEHDKKWKQGGMAELAKAQHSKC